jgi:hypothetical protein
MSQKRWQYSQRRAYLFGIRQFTQTIVDPCSPAVRLDKLRFQASHPCRVRISIAHNQGWLAFARPPLAKSEHASGVQFQPGGLMEFSRGLSEAIPWELVDDDIEIETEQVLRSGEELLNDLSMRATIEGT